MSHPELLRESTLQLSSSVTLRIWTPTIVFNSISFSFLPCSLYPSHLRSVCPRCQEIIPPLQTEAVPHLLPNSLWLLGYHLQWKGHGEDKPVQRYTVCWMLFIPSHEITCQFGLKRELSNIILITLADVKEHQPACFPSLCFGLVSERLCQNVAQEKIWKYALVLFPWHHIVSMPAYVRQFNSCEKY